MKGKGGGEGQRVGEYFVRVVGMVGSWNGGQVGMAIDLQKNGRCC
nr:MAG TPA: hypothetical protein [Caudoviricetes sp.]DAY30738.1 MAG TPA: hypothetical protein [Caudoviricetes sp.]